MQSRALFCVSFFSFVVAGVQAYAQVVEAHFLRAGRVTIVPQMTGVAGMPPIGGINASLGVCAISQTPTLPSPVAYQAAALAPAAGGLKTPAEQSLRLNAVFESIVPALNALKDPSLDSSGAKAAGQMLMNKLLDTSEPGASAVPGVYAAAPPSGKGSRSQSMVSQVSYAEGVSTRQREFFDETLSRRKAGWNRGFAQMGVKLQGRVKPVLSVKAAEDRIPKMAAASEVRYIVEWSQGETRLGAFKVTIRLKDMKLVFSRLSAPPAAEDKQIRIRLRGTVIAEAFPIEVEVTPAMIEEFFEAHGLRVLGNPEKATWLVAVTGEARADAVARELSGQGLALYATPVKGDIPESSQLWAMFKKKTVEDTGVVETSVNEGAISKTLREAGLRVLETERNGTWKLGAYDGVPAEAAAAKLASSGLVLYAVPLRFEAAQDRQVVVEFKTKVLVDLSGVKVEASVSEDDIARVLAEGGFTVVGDYGANSYRLQAPAGTRNLDALAALLATKLVKKGVAVGTLGDERIRRAAQDAADRKGRPWSESAYYENLSAARTSLELAGATQAQLVLFDKLADEAPALNGGFNPWSGD
ncbi:MAG TPA: hypothetical protein DD417_10150 [Elusimicrobia bacterium]|nr:MAG: hypothetical protein A2X37_04970 [Elusimicrobia bacterium GWA2_66_18]OGR76906.1 MAG: hypothetical protein A2X40_03910 [Elusimicrobia bacterium GWC2_65_9]HBL17085.1 hypothetical protein [Elusimicrobiota bacterium]